MIAEVREKAGGVKLGLIKAQIGILGNETADVSGVTLGIAIAAVRKAGRRGLARSRHIQEAVNIIAEIKGKGGEVKLGWVKAHIGISGNEAADTIAKKAAESVKP